MPPIRLACALVVLVLPAAAASAADPPAAPWPLAIVERAVALERGPWVRWRTDYKLRNDGGETLLVEPSEVAARVAGWVSNSRATGHAVPRRSEVAASGRSGGTGSTEIIAASDETKRCRENLTVRLWPAKDGPAPPEPTDDAPAPTLEVAPGDTLRVRLLLEHEHALCGTHTALLGQRDLELDLGPATFRDVLPLDRQGRVDAPLVSWPPEPPAEFQDQRLFLTAPGSLRLESHIPGKRSYRFPDYKPVIGGTRFRLSFWYLVAPGTAGRCQARVTQYRDLPSSFKTLYDGEVLEDLPITGRWVRVERLIQAEPEATVLTLDFRITEGPIDIGSLWIDDIRLEPLDNILAGP